MHCKTKKIFRNSEIQNKKSKINIQTFKKNKQYITLHDHVKIWRLFVNDIFVYVGSI